MGDCVKGSGRDGGLIAKVGTGALDGGVGRTGNKLVGGIVKEVGSNEGALDGLRLGLRVGRRVGFRVGREVNS
jgi:hypothetical protein